MKIRYAKSIKMPTLNSYFVSKFDEETLEKIKEKRPFSYYHSNLKEYEITLEVLKYIDFNYLEKVVDETVKYPIFERIYDEKYGYQKDAVVFARKTDNILINFPQGLGKSRTTMMIIDDRKFFKTLIICGQSNLQEEWIKDAIKHDYKELLNFNIIGEITEATSAKKAKWIKDNEYIKGVDLINIEALRNSKILAAINAVAYNCIVVDEVQSAKGWKAQQTIAMHEIKETKRQMRIALSGTPILNGPLEFYSVLRFLRQLDITARTTYERYYGIWGFDMWGHYYCKGVRNLNALKDLLTPVLAYISKDELNLPIKRRKKIKLSPIVNKQYSYLRKVNKMSGARMRKEGFTSKPQVRAEMQYLSSIANEKIEYIINLDKKVLVFSQYVKALEKVQSELIAKEKKVLFYHGALNTSERLAILELWRENNYDVLLLSIMSARYGLNLTEATDVVFLEPPVSFAVMEQAEDRTHRIGQDKEVMSHLLVSTEIDESRLDNIVSKQDTIEELNYLIKK